MTTMRDGGNVTFSCDGCPEVFEPNEPTREFQISYAAARAAGWMAFQEKGEWLHRCPGCKRRNR